MPEASLDKVFKEVEGLKKDMKELKVRSRSLSRSLRELTTANTSTSLSLVSSLLATDPYRISFLRSPPAPRSLGELLKGLPVF